jgi:transposase
VPLSCTLTGANRHDVTELLPAVDAIPPVRGKPGRPRRRPKRLYADRAYDSGPHRDELRRRGIRPEIARRKTPHGSGLGAARWVVERTISWLHRFRRLGTRYERDDGLHEAFMDLGCSLVCLRFL